jgi:Glycosyltransferase family 87
MLNKIQNFLMKKNVVVVVYFIVALVTAIKQYSRASFNNYKIFKNVYWHTLHKLPLYEEYPTEYIDHNFYGPFFAYVIAPFSNLPDFAGSLLWAIFLTSIFLYGVLSMPLQLNAKILILWICLHEFLTAILSFQFNVAIVGLILLSFVMIEKRKYIEAAALLTVGFLVKLYGIVILALIFNVKNKVKFVGTISAFIVLLGVSTSLIGSWDFTVQSYGEWFHSLISKSNYNVTLSGHANISLVGIMDKVFGIRINVLYYVLFGGSILGIILLRFTQHPYFMFRLFVLNYVLFCIVLFNTNVESPTYIIPFVAVATWFLGVEKNNYTRFLFVFCMILTSFSPSDLFPRYINLHYVRPYALKALPVFLIWLDLTYRLLKHNFDNYNPNYLMYKYDSK